MLKIHQKSLQGLLLFLGIIFLVLPLEAKAYYQNQQVNFFIDKSYDISNREEVPATLIYISPKLYFYVENNYWNSLNDIQKQEILNYLNILSQEFENKIYPTLTSLFGSERKPGIDKDDHITILLHQMKKESGGYFNSGNGYPKTQYSLSNEREMIYLNIEHIKEDAAKNFLSHEFMHLISFSQKELVFNVQEDIWLNEARSEYTSTLLNYDSAYEGSALQKRTKVFLNKSSDSLTEWQGNVSDYGVLNLFTQYLVDHYGIDILSQSLKIRETGIESINKILAQKNIPENFATIFTNWTITALINDCSYGEKYCYKNENLKKLRVVPISNFLPIAGTISLQISKDVKNWSGNWEKFIGGSGNLKLEFTGSEKANFKIPYIIEDLDGKVKIDFLKLDFFQKGKIDIPDFGKKNTSLTLIPLIQDKISDFSGNEPSCFYTLKISIAENKSEKENYSVEEQKKRELLIIQIAKLKEEIRQIQIQIVLKLIQKIKNKKAIKSRLFLKTN